LLAIFFLAVTAGCVSLPPAMRDYGALAAPVELGDTPFFPQEQYQCGPAALATVLAASGAGVTLQLLVEQVYLPGRRGSLQAELIAATRRAGRVPYPIAPGMAAIAAELQASRPVLVLQDLGVAWLEQWHYAVVVGIDPGADRVVLRSGVNERALMRAAAFLRSWRKGGYWGMVALRPGELPAAPDRQAYLDAVAGLEAVGQTAAARAAWQAALDRWPGDAVASFGLANAELSLGEPARAEALYLQLLRADPANLAARNNLAYALARQGKREQAIAQLRKALEQAAEDPALRAELEDSLREIRGE